MQTPPNTAADAAPRAYRMAFLPLYLLFAGLCLAMALFSMTDPSMGVGGALMLLAMLLAAFALLVFAVTRPASLAVGPEGVWPGNPKNRRCAPIPWAAIAEAAPMRLLHLRYCRLRVTGRADRVYLPLNLRDYAAFEADVLRLAPEGNPLRLFLQGAPGPQYAAASPVHAAASPVPAAAMPASETPAPQQRTPAADAPAPDEAAVAEAQRRIAADNSLKSGANWFFWVAALSLVNTAAVLLGWEWSFVIGLGTTQIVDGLALGVAQEIAQGGWVVQTVGVVLDILIAGVFAAAGLLARRRHRWAFIAGMALYALDMVPLLLLQDWAAAGFHLLGLWGMFTGLRALRAPKGAA